MKRWNHIALLALLTACGDADERAAQHALYAGAEPYKEARYSDAAAIYATAIHDPRVIYDLGNTLLRRSLLDSALHAYQQASDRNRNDSLNAMTDHNLGTTWTLLALKSDSMAKAGEAKVKEMRIEGADVASKVRMIVARDSIILENRKLEQLQDSALAQAANALKNGLRRRPMDEDTRHNLALVQQRIAARVKEAEEKAERDKNNNKGLSARAQALMQKADELVDAYKFNEALKVLLDGLKAEPSLGQKQDYMNKLDVVTKAAQAK